MSLAQDYMDGLKEAYERYGEGRKWEHLEEVMQGASIEDIDKLRALYPDVPDTLISLLKMVDGTYFRKYGDEEVTFYLLGSDVDEGEYPYYLLSVQQMMDAEGEIPQWGDDLISPEGKAYGYIDERICDYEENARLLRFSDCVNNGGTSQLFIDFAPSAKGTEGQIVRYLHDPDELKVIADSFDDYLRMIMDGGYGFINDHTAHDFMFFPLPE